MMRETAVLPRPAGEYPVGLRHTEFIGAGGMGADKVPISLTIFYPALKAEGEAVPYAFPEVLASLGVDRLDTRCLRDAPMAGGGPFPLLIYSHGYFTYEMSNAVLCTDLASHGYVAASIGHTHEGLVRLPDGRVYAKSQRYLDAICTPEMDAAAERILNEAQAIYRTPEASGRLSALARQFHTMHNGNLNDRAVVWAEHTTAAAQVLHRLHATRGDAFFGRLDVGRGIGLTGHSFGGATAANCCADDVRFPCGINIDGAQIGSSFGRDIGKPFMSISGGQGGGILWDMFVRNTADAYNIAIPDVGHMGLTDRGLIGQTMGKTYPEVGAKDPAQVRELLLECHLLFFGRYLLGRELDLNALKRHDILFDARPARKGGISSC